MTATITPATDHTIKTLDKLPTDRPKGANANWHQVTCSCGWTRKYVSHYRAIVMHANHTRTATSPDYEADDVSHPTPTSSDLV